MSVIDDNARFEDEDKAIMDELDIPEQDPNAVPEEFLTEDRPEVDRKDMVEISMLDLVESGYEALKVTFSAALAQMMGGDPLMAKQVFVRLTNDVDAERQRFIEMKAALAAEVEAIQEDDIQDGE